MELRAELISPLIQDYKDYRQFLQDYYVFKKSHRKGFSYRQFSQLAGLKSPNYLQLVMRGERNLSEEMAENVGLAMGLKVAEKRYFISLVRQENAKTDDELRKAQSEGLIALKKLVAKYLNKEAEGVLSQWHHLVVRELTALEDFESDGKWISKKLGGLIDEEAAEESLRLLLRAGFIKQEKSRFIPTDPVIDSGDETFTHLKMSHFHAQTLRMWAKALPEKNPKNLELGVLTLSLPKEKIPQLQSKIRDFQDEILGMLKSETASDTVVQIGTYLVPLTD